MTTPPPIQISPETMEAAIVAAENCGCDDRGYWSCCIRRAVEAVAPLIAAQVLRAYELKVEDFARETARLSLLVQAVMEDGHRPDPAPRHAHCRVCQALQKAIGGGGGDGPAER